MNGMAYPRPDVIRPLPSRPSRFGVNERYRDITLFGLIPVLHAVRLLRAWQVTIEGAVVPIWVSWMGLAGGAHARAKALIAKQLRESAIKASKAAAKARTRKAKERKAQNG